MGTEHEVVIIAEATALPGKRDELRRAFDRLVPKSRAEEGVSTFRLHEDRDRPGRFVLYERFRDQSAIDLHVTLEHLRRSCETSPSWRKRASRSSRISTS